ncbi:adenine-specific DNA-methyltransferase [Nitrosomonas sp. Nm33]|nr:adenine-specific DNA-methyltransferase [Nitrosomonas sp. Nm33]
MTIKLDSLVDHSLKMIKPFRDTCELNIHFYLTYLHDKLFQAKESQHGSGSLFVQISDENLHPVRELMDDVFKQTNYLNLTFQD